MLTGKRQILYNMVKAGIDPVSATKSVYPTTSDPKGVWLQLLDTEEFSEFVQPAVAEFEAPTILLDDIVPMDLLRATKALTQIGEDCDASAAARVAAIKALADLQGWSPTPPQFTPHVIIYAPQGAVLPAQSPFIEAEIMPHPVQSLQ